jgi:hypothetical protein
VKNPTAKGKRLEYKIASLIRRKGLDDNAKRMPRSGALAHLPEDILTSLPIHIEAKNRERVRLWEWWEETSQRTFTGHHPVLVVSGNHRPVLAIVDIDYLLDLLKAEQDYLADVTDIKRREK